MPELILTGFVLTANGAEEFAVYRHRNLTPEASSHFSCVDHKHSAHGWVTLNASGGLAGYALEYKVYFDTAADCVEGSSKGKPFPHDPLSHATDAADLAARFSGHVASSTP